jgi:hypothetical protein
MQEVYKQIYDMAEEEVNLAPFDFGGEKVIFYKGFRSSKSSDGSYGWKDMRHDEYYEDVNPLITERVLEVGFKDTLTEVLIHDDYDKIVKLNRRVIAINSEITFLVKKSIEAYNQNKRLLREITYNPDLTDLIKEQRLEVISIKHEKRRKSLKHRRRFLRTEKDAINKEVIYYKERIKHYKLNLNK